MIRSSSICTNNICATNLWILISIFTRTRQISAHASLIHRALLLLDLRRCTRRLTTLSAQLVTLYAESVLRVSWMGPEETLQKI